MKIEFDPRKSERNEAERGLPFSAVADFELETAVTAPDTRFDYPEPRYVAKGLIDGRLHVRCYTPILDGIRVISFRKANAREVRKHEEQAVDR